MRTVLLGLAMLAGLAALPRCDARPEPLLERVARVEHEQWMAWSKSVADEVSPERRARWQKLWVPYEDLPEDMKELDRRWARRVLAEVER
ncbi:MAG: hypothetical protein AAF211_26350 [Myxococcota bacterium]